VHVDIPGSSAIAEFYDGLASDYHLIYADRWEQSLRHQGGALDALTRSSLPEARDVLDCACGIGTQAIGLALLGYRVTGTDISERSLQRARDTAAQLGTPLTVLPADFRDLRGVPGEFDVVTACDNAIAHLLDQADVDLALKQMYRKLRPGGLLAISVRDYDRALKDRPATAPPIDIPGPPRRVVVRLHEWDTADSPLHTVRFLILTQQSTGWTLTEHATRLRAITAAQLGSAATRAGFEQIRWLDAAQARFHQPIMTGRRGDQL
jgi:glycine/sarcosine N-methyltransferase